MKRKIFIRLIGGIGNQLFQYACAKNLAIELNASYLLMIKQDFFLIESLIEIIVCQKI